MYLYYDGIHRTLETIVKYSVDDKAINGRNSSVQSALHVAVLADKGHNITTLLQGKVMDALVM